MVGQADITARTKFGLAMLPASGETPRVATYGQYCPIARASEILAQRWTPIILRNLLNGCSTFGEIASAAPGIPRSLLTSRLRELERVGVVWSDANPSGRGSLYHLTKAGEDLKEPLTALGTWGERWLELAPEHCDPYVVLWTWCNWYLEYDRLPRQRVVVQFEFADQAVKNRHFWLIFDGQRSEVCRNAPGYETDLFVQAESMALAEWHLGRLAWDDAVRADRIRVHGPARLRRILPTWNRRSAFAGVHARRPSVPLPDGN
jgi:DNA-binding HxlR family transcriptional regulator